MVRRVGYGRVSTHEQNLDLQISALNFAGCAELYTDQGISGADFERPGLIAALKTLGRGEMLVVWRLDRLGRSLLDLIKLVNSLGERGIEFRSLTESIDTSSSGGRLTFHIMAAMAEFERALIGERTRAGMAAARARGSHIGRRPALTAQQKQNARYEVEMLNNPVSEVALRYGVHPRTLTRVLRQDEDQDLISI
jgi:DNA invertase Pin-like site-specific DNA recombinase